MGEQTVKTQSGQGWDGEAQGTEGAQRSMGLPRESGRAS